MTKLRARGGGVSKSNFNFPKITLAEGQRTDENIESIGCIPSGQFGGYHRRPGERQGSSV